MLQISPVVKKILLLNIISYFFTVLIYILFGLDVVDYLGLFPKSNPNYQFYQYLTYLFMHGNIMHLLFNMLALFSFGPDVEYRLGNSKFILFYFIIGALSGFIQMTLKPGILIGSSGAIFGLMTLYTMYNPKNKLSIFFLPIYIESRKILSAILIFEFFLAILDSDNVGHWTHLSGSLFGFILFKLDEKFKINI